MLLGHGDDAYQYQHEILADFSTNVWYDGEPAGLKEYVFENWRAVNRYPEVMGESLTRKIRQHHQLEIGEILVNSGTTESIYLIAQLFSGRKTTIVTPSFSEYEDACMMHGHEISYLSWKDISTVPTLQSDVIFICNPNNPTGEIFHDLEAWILKNPACLFVVDEAFIEFTIDIESAIPQIQNYQNLIVMRSLTKAFAIPGLRLGYVAGPEEWVAQLLNIKQPWTVNSIALTAGNYIFDHFSEVQIPLKELLADKLEFTAGLQKNECLRVHQSHTHFFLVETKVRNAAQLKTFLLEKHGLLIRDAANFRGLTRQYFRLATLNAEKNTLLIDALEEWKTLYW